MSSRPAYENNWSEDDDPSNSDSPIEADSGDEGSTVASVSSTRSVRDSIYDTITENGRTYNRWGNYFLPNDTPELERLNLQYVVLQQLLGNREHFAPLRRPKKILDIGTGTGIWCYEMGRKYPRAYIVGTDMAPVQMKHIAGVDNVQFHIEDAADENWGRSKWDYIHTRMMLGSFNDFRQIIRRSFLHLDPGGYMESQELWPRIQCDDGTLDPETHKFSEWIKYQDEAAMRLGMPLRIANKLKRWYQEAGFIDVKEEILRIPINGWPKDPRYKMLGKWWGRTLLDGLQGFTLSLFTKAFNWTAEEIEVYLVDVRRSIADRRVHAYHSVYVVHGRKPTTQEQAIIDERKARGQSTTTRELSEILGSLSISPQDPPPTAGPSRPQPSSFNEMRHAFYGDPPPLNSNRRPRHPFSSSPHPHITPWEHQ